MGFADDYNDVASRLRQFREKYPDGSLQPADPTKPYSLETIGSDTYVIYCAAAYRNPEDPRPGIGIAWEPVPGKTNFTRGSEIQNAETSAWGRAIVATLAADTKRIASDEEIRSARGPQVAAKQRIDDLVGAIKRQDLDVWVKEQDFSWPWSDETCDAIDAKLVEKLHEPF